MDSEEIRNTVLMSEVLIRYGLSTNRNGFMKCPFHNDHDASMKIYDKSFCCYGCQVAGDVFKFVMLMDGVDFKSAYQELGGTYEHYQKGARNSANKLAKQRRVQARETYQQKLDDLHSQIDKATKRYQTANDVVRFGEGKPTFDVQNIVFKGSDEWWEALEGRAMADIQLSELERKEGDLERKT